MTIIVNNKAIKVIGEINGTNVLLNHSSPFIRMSEYRLITPKAKGIPKIKFKEQEHEVII